MFQYMHRLSLGLLIYAPLCAVLWVFGQGNNWLVFVLLFLATLLGVCPTPLIFNYYVRHNAQKIYLKFGSVKGQNIKFKDIDHIEVLCNVLIFRMKSGDAYVFDIKKVKKESINYLLKIVNTSVRKLETRKKSIPQKHTAKNQLVN